MRRTNANSYPWNTRRLLLVEFHHSSLSLCGDRTHHYTCAVDKTGSSPWRSAKFGIMVSDPSASFMLMESLRVLRRRRRLFTCGAARRGYLSCMRIEERSHHFFVVLVQIREVEERITCVSLSTLGSSLASVLQTSFFLLASSGLFIDGRSLGLTFIGNTVLL